MERVRVDALVEWMRPGSHDPPWSWLDETCDLIATQGAEFGALINHIRQHGIQEPVILGDDGRVWDGHHRICAALIIGPGTVVPFKVAGK